MSAGSVALVVPGDFGIADLYELGIPAAVFGTPQPDLADPWYELWMCGTGNRTHGTKPGFTLHSDHTLEDIVRADTVIVSWVPDEVFEDNAPVPPDLVNALRDAHDNGARIVSACVGAYALAEAGLLDAGGPPRTGCTPPCWPSATRRSRSTPRSSTSTRVTS
jgi:AraC family transcriptional regulator, transcriptional activator FtrA